MRLRSDVQQKYCIVSETLQLTAICADFVTLFYLSPVADSKLSYT